MSEQSLALRLADALEQRDYECSLNSVVKELRRLHELNEDLYQQGVGFIARIEKDEALLRQALEALEIAQKQLAIVWSTPTQEVTGAVTAIRQHLGETE